MPEDQWVKELHEKLPSSLRTQMGVYRRQYAQDYDAYVDLAQDLARELALADQDCERRRQKASQPGVLRPLPRVGPSAPRPTPPAFKHNPSTSTPTPPRKPSSGPVICYRCQKPGHYSHECPQAENKAIEPKEPSADLANNPEVTEDPPAEPEAYDSDGLGKASL